MQYKCNKAKVSLNLIKFIVFHKEKNTVDVRYGCDTPCNISSIIAN